jgi:hypothetical protein
LLRAALWPECEKTGRSERGNACSASLLLQVSLRKGNALAHVHDADVPRAARQAIRETRQGHGKDDMRRILLLLTLCLGGCAVNDSRVALEARTRLIGLTELQLESCAGVPDQKAAFGGTDILTYYAGSTSSTGLTIPLIGGVSKSYGGYCHTIVRVDDGKVTAVRYAGEKDAVAAVDAFCAPTVRGCVYSPPSNQPAAPAEVATGSVMETSRPPEPDSTPAPVSRMPVAGAPPTALPAR